MSPSEFRAYVQQTLLCPYCGCAMVQKQVKPFRRTATCNNKSCAFYQKEHLIPTGSGQVIIEGG